MVVVGEGIAVVVVEPVARAEPHETVAVAEDAVDEAPRKPLLHDRVLELPLPSALGVQESLARNRDGDDQKEQKHAAEALLPGECWRRGAHYSMLYRLE
jgi:hypothetical protein